MAKVTAQSVPPSLANAFSSIISSYDWYNRSDTISRLSSAIRTPSTVDDRPPLLRYAWAAAELLATKYLGKFDTATRRAFVAARLDEIINNNFTTEYWNLCTVPNTKVRVRVPFCYSSPGSVAPAYQDPTRLAAHCYYSSWSSQYNVPTPYSDLPTPSLGWRGEVTAGQYKDLWCTSLLYDVLTPNICSHQTDRPMFAVIDYTIELSASFRGNRFWGSLNLGCQAASSYLTSDDYNHKLHNTINPEFAYYLPIDPPATPWSQTITRQAILDCWSLQYRPKTNSYTHMLIHVSPIPPWGRYFARNDFCQSWVTPSILAWQANY